jgi:hypothetical protein
MESYIPENHCYDEGPSTVPLSCNVIYCTETFICPAADDYTGAAVIEENCNILLTRALRLPTGEYSICVTSGQPNEFESWYIQQGIFSPAVQTSTSSTDCFTFLPGSNQFLVRQKLDSDSCFISFTVDTTSTCPEKLFEVVAVSPCGGTMALVFEDTSFNNGYEYYVDWGDLNYSAGNSDSLTHTYCGFGISNRTVCVTYSTSSEEPLYQTCCYSITVDIDPDCICDSISVSVVEQMCDTVKVAIEFPEDVTDDTIRVEIVSLSLFFEIYGDTTICIIYPEVRNDTICLSYSICSDTPNECCKPINVIPRCETADFDFDLHLPAQSCINPCYDITPKCTLGGDNIHVWEMDDGTVFYGTNPPSCYLFSNFANDDNEVCVRHYILFCDSIIADTTKCVEYPRHAILGRPGGTIRLTDAILDPNLSGWTVEDFIRHFSKHPTIPLVIDGTLELDKGSIFKNGIWNMAWDAEILNDGQLFGLIDVKIQSADRDVRGNTNYSCCRWLGVRSKDKTRTNWSGSTISDAQIMLHFQEQSSSGMPRIVMNNGTYHTNIYGIKSNQQAFLVGAFSGNEFRGADHRDTICDCVAQNAIDVRGVEEVNGFAPIGHNPTFSGGIKFPKTGNENLIHFYEQGFHFENTNLQTWNFEIKTLMDFQEPISLLYRWVAGLDNPTDATGIGIDFDYNHLLPSFLEFDRMHFRDHRIGVRDRHRTSRFSSPHYLTAVAESEHSSITMKRLDEGYNVRYSSTSGLHGQITGNLLDSIRGSGIRVSFISSRNTTELDIVNNEVTIDGSNVEEAGGITVVQTVRGLNDQLVSIGLNRVDIKTSSADANGIQMSNVGTGRIWNNYVEATNSNQAISVIASPRALIRCNEGWYGLRGLESVRNMDSELSANYFRANGTNVELTGDHMTTSGMEIWWNNFHNSVFNNVVYNTDVVTGQQDHARYNTWFQGQDDQIVHLGIASDAELCQFWRPDSQTEGDLNFPNHNPGELFTDRPDPMEIDTLFCVLEDSTSPPILTVEVLDDLDTLYAHRLSDTSLYEGYSAAMITELDLHIFRLIETYPDWKDSSQVIEDFYNTHDTGYIGQLSALEDSLVSLEQFMSSANTTVAPYQNEILSIYLELDTLNAAFVQSTDSLEQDSLVEIIEGYTAVIDSLGVLIEAERSYSDSILNVMINALIDQNELLPDTADHQWTRKTLNDIVLHYMQSDTLRSGDDTDLLTIAGYCYSDGGAPVYDARSLAWALLDDVIYEDHCVQASPLPSSVPNVTARLQTLTLAPNPAGDEVQISWETHMDEKVRIEMLSISGQLMRSVELNNSEAFYIMNLSGVPTGTYMVRVGDGKHIQVGKLIIN